jgi:hypothetical protein
VPDPAIDAIIADVTVQPRAQEAAKPMELAPFVHVMFTSAGSPSCRDGHAAEFLAAVSSETKEKQAWSR